MISIVIPIHNMKNKDFFLDRCLASVREQSYQDYEIIITEKGKMAENTNSGIREAKGELIKILFMDDWFAHKDALKDIINNFKKDDIWMITGCNTNPHPYWTDDIETGNNRLGSPSALTMRGKHYFDETLSWLLDCDLYRRLYNQHGAPKILDSVNVNIGVGDHQMTHILTNEEKLLEHKYMQDKWK